MQKLSQTLYSNSCFLHLFIPFLQVSPELHSPGVSDALMPSVSADVHSARERRLCSAKQLLHH